MTPLKVALLSVAALLIAAPALADTATFSLTTVDPAVQPGGTVTFNGVIAAPASNAGLIFLNADSFTVDAPLALDDSDFLLDSPFSLSPGMSYIGPLFTVTLPASTAEGLYRGLFQLDLSTDTSNFTDSADFQVTATPEPGSWLLLATGLASAAALRRRFHSALL